MEIVASEELVDLAKDAFDAGVRFGELRAFIDHVRGHHVNVVHGSRGPDPAAPSPFD